jgi:hypothetical protein
MLWALACGKFFKLAFYSSQFIPTAISATGDGTNPMPTQTARNFRTGIAGLRAALLELPPALADVPWRAGGWTRKEIVGHLLDSASNNRQRFVRAAIDGNYSGPGYAQDAWVAAHGYRDVAWEALLRWWRVEHEILMAAVDRIPEERLEASCVIGDDEPVTLRVLIEDYLHHQQHHFRQLQADESAPWVHGNCKRKKARP